MAVDYEWVEHERFGGYEQVVGDQDEVGYEPIAGDPQARYGWNMPDDEATRAVLDEVARGCRLLEIGPGDGTRIALPALRRADTTVLAVDVNVDLLRLLRSSAVRQGTSERLTTLAVPPTWWERVDWLDRLAGVAGTVDLVIARQVLQFGSLGSVLNVLELATRVLSAKGQMWIMNMSPYLGYIYELPWGLKFAPDAEGAMIEAITVANKDFELQPGQRERPNQTGSEVGRPFVPYVQQFAPFIWFDESLFRGAVSLIPGLRIMENYTFSPSRIWRKNKLQAGPPEWQQRELHVGVLGRA